MCVKSELNDYLIDMKQYFPGTPGNDLSKNNSSGLDAYPEEYDFAIDALIMVRF
jgi:hypothetical protein